MIGFAIACPLVKPNNTWYPCWRNFQTVRVHCLGINARYSKNRISLQLDENHRLRSHPWLWQKCSETINEQCNHSVSTSSNCDVHCKQSRAVSTSYHSYITRLPSFRKHTYLEKLPFSYTAEDLQCCIWPLAMKDERLCYRSKGSKFMRSSISGINPRCRMIIAAE